uniref:Uncharacterized protein n=1 Tax=Oryza brachyantha TaxID=4533 RepID=J3N4I4_ORYBR
MDLCWLHSGERGYSGLCLNGGATKWRSFWCLFSSNHFAGRRWISFLSFYSCNWCFYSRFDFVSVRLK